jgi:hypothetical protein
MITLLQLTIELKFTEKPQSKTTIQMKTKPETLSIKLPRGIAFYVTPEQFEPKVECAGSPTAT